VNVRRRQREGVTPARVERATYGLGNRCSIHLSYEAVAKPASFVSRNRSAASGIAPRAAAAALALLTVALASGCRRGPNAELGPAESFLLLAPTAKSTAAEAPAGMVMHRLALDQEPALTLVRILNDGFASEMLRTVHIAKQLVRQGPARGPYTDEVRAAAADPVCLVVGADGTGPSAQGLALESWLGAPAAHPRTRWVGLSGNIEGDKALVQTVSGRLAAHAADWVARGAVPGPSQPLVEAYAMAMEVIAREWRAGTGAAGAMPSTAGTMDQRRLFARVRENAAVLTPDGTTLRPPAEILADPAVAATVIHRLAQTRAVAHSAGPAAIYAPFVAGQLPAGVNPALVLGPVRNFQAKLFSAWGQAVAEGRPPADIVDLLLAYTKLFPGERSDVVRIFLVTTFAATVIPGGFSRAPADATASIAKVTALTDDILADRRGLRDALGTPAGDSARGSAGKKP
jgi:hypothetical protein